MSNWVKRANQYVVAAFIFSLQVGLIGAALSIPCTLFVLIAESALKDSGWAFVVAMYIFAYCVVTTFFSFFFFSLTGDTKKPKTPSDGYVLLASAALPLHVFLFAKGMPSAFSKSYFMAFLSTVAMVYFGEKIYAKTWKKIGKMS